jgi:hypothetical protein
LTAESASNPPPALLLESLSFTGEPTRVLKADIEFGTYLKADIQELVDLMDRRVPDQVGWRVGSNLTAAADNPPSPAPLPECVGVYHDSASTAASKHHSWIFFFVSTFAAVYFGLWFQYFSILSWMNSLCSEN